MFHLDLFSGVGGFSLAAQWAGFETIAFCEKNEFCRKILFKNWPDIIIYDDIKTMNFTASVNLITGGFPCQPFSVAGKRKGKKDERYLWPEMYRIIRESKPNWVIAENPTGIVGMELDNILDDLENENYETQSFIIPACAANAPHRRDRLWIIANRLRERCNKRGNNWQDGSISKNIQWNMAALQQEWAQFKPKSWEVNQARKWFEFNARVSRVNDGIPNRLHRIKSLGNAIVPQCVYPIIKTIAMIEGERHDS